MSDVEQKSQAVCLNSLGEAFEKTNVTGFVSKSFQNNLFQALQFMDEQNADLEALLDDADLFLDSDDATNPRDREYTEEAEDLHDEIVSHLDAIALSYGFMLKNAPYLRQAMAGIRHEVSGQLALSPDYLQNADNVRADLFALYDDVFPVLYKLREEFSSEICRKRKAEAWGDEFASTFLAGKELTPDIMPNRLEFLFFEQYGIPLNVFERSPNLETYLDDILSGEHHIHAICTDLKRGELQEDFPGFHLINLRGIEPRPRTNHVLSLNSQNLRSSSKRVTPIFKPRNGLI